MDYLFKELYKNNLYIGAFLPVALRVADSLHSAEAMRRIVTAANHSGIIRTSGQVYFHTAPKLKQCRKEEGNEPVTSCHAFKMSALDGKIDRGENP